MNISKQIVGYLRSRSLVLASVETCTAGAIGAMLAEQRGAPGCLDLGCVAHSEAALAALPGVSAQTIARFGLFSESIAREAAEGALARSAGRASVALASIGLPGLEDDGIGVAVAHCFAWACFEGGCVVSAGETVWFSGRRNEIRRSIARRALLGLPRFVDSVIACAK
ncbi:CinA family protein [Paraburkholderia lycopersici]|uniref:Amidohydrolase, PncC family n=1 Tax=Paraburkholderia lycopersici TaxID=416944 RepID=A0A1G6SYB0_9BURK|nr:CinA family protein [Paraburkholderia lycopersici]SDD21246.1 amidohydrolase, PncC family [Paraburkholderia lycopersici]